jgi:hypothetical protein
MAIIIITIRNHKRSGNDSSPGPNIIATMRHAPRITFISILHIHSKHHRRNWNCPAIPTCGNPSSNSRFYQELRQRQRLFHRPRLINISLFSSSSSIINSSSSSSSNKRRIRQQVKKTPSSATLIGACGSARHRRKSWPWSCSYPAGSEFAAAAAANSSRLSHPKFNVRRLLRTTTGILDDSSSFFICSSLVFFFLFFSYYSQQLFSSRSFVAAETIQGPAEQAQARRCHAGFCS